MVMKNTQIDFGSPRLFRNCLRATFPLMAAQILNLLYNIVDRIYIGRIADGGALALGGVGLCFPIIIIITGFANMFGFGGAPLCAMARGGGNKERAEHIMNTAFRLIIVTALIITALVFIFCEPLMRLFGASDANIIYAVPYMRIYTLGTPFIMIALGMNPFVSSQGFPKISMYTVLVGTILNFILDPLFIFTFHMGVKGAALATILSQIVSCIWVLCFLFGKSLELRLHLKHFWKMDVKTAVDIVSLGVSSFVMQCTNSIVAIVCNKLLAGYGGDMYVSIMTIINSERQILSTPIEAFCDGITPILSYNYGAGDYKKVKKTIFIMTILSAAYSIAGWLLIMVIPKQMLRIFSEDTELVNAGVSAMKCYFAAFAFMTFQSSGQTVFKALNKKKQAIFFSIFRKVIIVVPLTFLLPMMGFGTLGIFMAEPFPM